jgi:hypothetical protein
MGAIPSRDEKIQWVNPHGEITSVVHDERVSIFLLQPITYFLHTMQCPSCVMQMRSMTISLDGLLDYDEEDREECTFEVK